MYGVYYGYSLSTIRKNEELSKTQKVNSQGAQSPVLIVSSVHKPTDNENINIHENEGPNRSQNEDMISLIEDQVINNMNILSKFDDMLHLENN
tara:strand:- start:165 stop:443 length:279 start_codon:yes stop_codon:yes gene_type:complete